MSAHEVARADVGLGDAVAGGNGAARLEDAYLGARIVEGQLQRRFLRPMQRELQRTARSDFRCGQTGGYAQEVAEVIRMNTATDKRHGPHAEQEVLDALDDVGSITACDNAVGLNCKLMEVMG